ncbi:transcription initiation factor IIB family protein [Natrialbaceae archaeon GCM10025896]
MASSNQYSTRVTRKKSTFSNHQADSQKTAARTEKLPSAETFDTSEGCIECGESAFAKSAVGEWYCRKCGTIHSDSEIEFTEPGWRPRNERRTGAAGPVSQVTVGTKIEYSNNHAGGRWARHNNRLRHDKETLRHGLKEIRAVAAGLEATSTTTKQAAHLYRRAADNGHLIGQSIEAMAAACVHAVARKNNIPFPLDQVVEVSPVTSSDIRSAYGKLAHELKISLAPPTPIDFIERVGTEADLSQPVRRRAREIAVKLVDNQAHVGQSPTGVAAAMLYGAAQEYNVEITQEELAKAAWVSPVTLSRQWQTVRECLNDI